MPDGVTFPGAAGDESKLVERGEEFYLSRQCKFYSPLPSSCPSVVDEKGGGKTGVAFVVLRCSPFVPTVNAIEVTQATELLVSLETKQAEAFAVSLRHGLKVNLMIATFVVPPVLDAALRRHRVSYLHSVENSEVDELLAAANISEYEPYTSDSPGRCIGKCEGVKPFRGVYRLLLRNWLI